MIKAFQNLLGDSPLHFEVLQVSPRVFHNLYSDLLGSCPCRPNPHVAGDPPPLQDSGMWFSGCENGYMNLPDWMTPVSSGLLWGRLSQKGLCLITSVAFLEQWPESVQLNSFLIWSVCCLPQFAFCCYTKAIATWWEKGLFWLHVPITVHH